MENVKNGNTRGPYLTDFLNIYNLLLTIYTEYTFIFSRYLKYPITYVSCEYDVSVK